MLRAGEDPHAEYRRPVRRGNQVYPLLLRLDERPYFPNPDETLEDWQARVRREGTELPQNVNTF